jgi:hypothetical protein
VALGEDSVGEVGDDDAHVALAEVQADRHAGVAVHGDEHRRAAHGAGRARVAAGGGLRHEPGGLQLGDRRRHGRRRQLRPAREIGTGHRPGLGEDPEHARTRIDP